MSTIASCALLSSRDESVVSYHSLTAVRFVFDQAHAGEVLVAVAGNFRNPMKEVTRAFEAETGHQTTVSPGSTGKLYAQLRHGAPHEVFLAVVQVYLTI